MMVNWQDNEAVVRAAVPSSYFVKEGNWEGIYQPSSIPMMREWLGRSWKDTRENHREVQAWEKANRPAEGRPKPRKIMTWAHTTGVIGSGCRMRSHKQGSMGQAGRL